MEDSDSSDYDNELQQRLRECAAIELSAHMSPHNINEVKESTLTSQEKVVEHKDMHSLKVTSGFRNHVAKKLSSYFDSILEVTDAKHSANIQINDNDIGSVKLLHCSSNPLGTGQVTCKQKHKRKQKLSSSESDTEMEKWKSVLVTGSDILNGGEGSFKCCKSKITNAQC